MTESTSFLLSAPSGTVRGTGVAARYDSVGVARAALADGAPAVVGLLAFDTGGPSALLTPRALTVKGVPLTGRAIAPSTSSEKGRTTPPEVHRARVVAALNAIAAGRVEKVVLARSMELTYDDPLDPESLAASFAAGAGAATVFAARGPGERWLIGASPELLVRKQGSIVTCHPYAGSAARSADPARDAAAAAALQSSDKDLREHAFVVNDLRERLAPLCRELSAPAAPILRSTGEMWHLATPIRGTLHDNSVTALDLAARLSPTPAVCGTPRAAAAELIAELEGPREFYGGAVGWCDARGDGQWLVSIRCLELGEDHRSMTTWAGGGIVAGSDPDAEVDETDAKFRTVRRALGLSD
ncbi:MAG: isochorismate synthase [Gordonia sp. (in: high G+C Gram-positive bacteria)]|uniref:isochorismate synthase n=1 Tax=Gordonia sp. (in: high G+C Gram-positive bacteria) TaxID=84139 RepID=UPI003BB53E34